MSEVTPLPRLAKRYAKRLDGRCRRESVRVGVAHAMSGKPLREAAAAAGMHHSTLRETLVRYGLVDEWKRLRVRRLCRQAKGDVPQVWARHFEGVRRPAWVRR
jgi:hypothetical protein